MNTSTSRRAFLGGGLAFVSLSSLSPLAAAQLGKPRIKFGVVTDVHFAYGGGPGLLKAWNENMFRTALEWYRKAKDAGLEDAQSAIIRVEKLKAMKEAEK